VSGTEISGVRNRFSLFLPCLSQFFSSREAGRGWIIARSSPAIYEWKSTHVSCARCRLVVTPRYNYSRWLINIDCSLCSRGIKSIPGKRSASQSCALATKVRLRIPGSRPFHRAKEENLFKAHKAVSFFSNVESNLKYERCFTSGWILNSSRYEIRNSF